MKKNRIRIFIILWIQLFFLYGQIPLLATGPFEITKNLPVAFQGRFRSLESATRLWLYDFYHLQHLKGEHLTSFQALDNSALELMWKLHILGPSFIENAPLFWIHYAEVKKILGLDIAQSRFSYKELHQAIFENKESNVRLMQMLLPYEYAKSYRSPGNRSRSTKLELRGLSAGLWVSLQDGMLVVSTAPKISPWNFLSTNMSLQKGDIDLETIEKQNKVVSEELLQIFHHLQAYKALSPSFNVPLNTDQSKLLEIGTTLKMLPSKLHPGEWLSLHTLNLESTTPKLSALKIGPNNQQFNQIANFTTFSDEDFYHLQLSYNDLKEKAIKYYNILPGENIVLIRNSLEESTRKFSEAYNKAYTSIVGQSYREAINKQLSYPTFWQLYMETWYYRTPLIELSLLAYCLAFILFFIGYMTKQKKCLRSAFAALAVGFIIHTLILILRCFILQRPPVSNMFETVIYVPWIAILLGLGLFIAFRQYVALISSIVASAGLLILLKLADVDARMENVQAVLDSQYWLIVHVLMIVASYGVFIVCGMLAHIYIVRYALQHQKFSSEEFMAKSILQTMYIGIALLIPGTILGGVWAAESWGRFWDWDPKESWAFISACIYVLIIHAYTFKKIHNYGLAVGAISGLMAISFTWYGVNYILGTGLHSYGFGKGGEVYYYGYLLIEGLFLTSAHSYVLLKNRIFR
jgi:ABC-type transport system involved in cytochrome c biogenesis permease subunit